MVPTQIEKFDFTIDDGLKVTESIGVLKVDISELKLPFKVKNQITDWIELNEDKKVLAQEKTQLILPRQKRRRVPPPCDNIE